MAMNIVEGYVVKTENEWCTPFALGEPKYSSKAKNTVIFFTFFGFSFLQVREKQRERAESSVINTNNTRQTS